VTAASLRFAPAPAASSPPGITTVGLTKRFGSVIAVDRLDLDIPSGSIFGLLGPNGAGKTTVIRLVVGLAKADAGSASIGGLDVGREASSIRRQVGALDQDPRFYAWMTGRELLALAGRLVGIGGRSVRARVDETLELVGLAEAGHRRIGGYSGGMRQRLGIAQALIGRPRLLILDEPVSALDPEGRRDLLGLIGLLRGEVTVLLSTHLLSDVERVCDRVAILDKGRVVIEGTINELLDRYALPIYRLEPEPGQEVAVAILSDRLRQEPWVIGVESDAARLEVTVSDSARARREILPLVAGAEVSLVAFERARPTLEDVFVTLVGKSRDPAAADASRTTEVSPSAL
jgi:ABC-2 type transport system ATP-binding protein